MVEWKLQDNDNYIGLYKNYILRVEQMGPQKWWWAVYKDNEDLCYDNPFVRNLDYGKKLAEQCVREDETNG